MPEPPDPSTRQDLEHVLAELRQRYEHGEAARVEELLQRSPGLREQTEWMLDLVYNEILLRRQAGETPRLLEYQGRFPELATELGMQFEVDDLIDEGSHDESTAQLPRGAGPPGALAGDSGPQVPGFMMRGKLGQGGMGTVWRAYQISTRRDVALKLMRTSVFDSDKDRLRFEREIEICARLQHPNIAQVYSSGEVGGVFYYALQLITGLPLDHFVHSKQLAIADIVRLMLKVCGAVQHAHQRGVIHRDLKPSNILVDHAGEPFVLDFGLAKATTGDTFDHGVTLTEQGMIVGTPAYMAPEQAAGKTNELDTRTDVYALGVILFRLLTGELPHAATGSSFDILRRIIDDDPRRPRAIKPGLHWELEAIVLKALEKNPARRYASAGELAADLRNHLNGEPITAHAATLGYVLRKRLRKHALAASVAAFVGLLAFTAVIFYIVSIQWEQANTYQEFVRAEKNATLAQQNAQKAEKRRQEADRQRDLAVQARDREMRQAYWTTVRLANDLVKRGEFGAGLRMLLDAPPELRGWEWGYLVAHGPLPDRTIQAHAGRVLDLATSPDKKRLFSAGADGTVVAWDTGSWQRLWQHDARAPVRSLACAPNGKQLVAGAGARLIVLAADSGQVVRALGQSDSNGYAQLQFYPDGDNLLTCQEFPERKNKYEYGILDTATWQPLPARLPADHVNGSLDLAGAYFMSGGSTRPNSFEWYDPKTLKPRDKYTLDPKYYAGYTSVHLDTRRNVVLALESFDPILARLSDHKVVSTRRFETGTNQGIVAAAVDWEGDMAGFVTATGELRVCNLEGKLLAAASHADAVSRIASLGQGRFVTAGRQGKVKLWNVSHLQVAPPVHGISPAWAKFHGKAFAASANNNWIACQTSIGRSFALGARDAATPWTVIQTNFGNQFQLLGFTPTDELIICHTLAKDTKNLQTPARSWLCWYAPDGRDDPLVRAVAAGGVVRAAQLDASAQHIILALEIGGVEVRNLDTQQPSPAVIAAKAAVVTISPDGKRAAALINDGAQLVVWQIDTGAVLGRCLCHIPRAAAACFHPAGEMIAISDRDGGITLIAVGQAEPAAYLQEHTGEITGMRFSADGTRLFTSALDHTVRVWDWQLGRDLLVLENGRYDYFDVALLDQGRTLAATSHRPKMQFHFALPWTHDEQSAEFAAAVSAQQRRDQGRRLAEELMRTFPKTDWSQGITMRPDVAPDVRHVALATIAHRVERPERLITVNTLGSR